MKLYHYSNKNIEKNISVDFFGNNSYTANDKKYQVNRSFFYACKNIPEYHLTDCKYLYIAEIENEKIYDLKEDRENLKNKFLDITELLLYIKKKYVGILYNIGFDVVCLFENIAIKEKIILQ